jgi:ABC-type antimicrobial peptide transport system permease subunit
LISYGAKVRAVVLLARNGLRRRGRALVGLAVVVALGIGAAIASLSAAWRTDHAYTEYLRRAEVADVVVNPSLLTDRIVDVIASAPGTPAVPGGWLVLVAVVALGLAALVALRPGRQAAQVAPATALRDR